ncbi:MAG: hypothetical protein C5S49_08450 [Candidatus Methanogaster sp.]|nr:MAG: hypothetical protein C5S49_08450 [ANME-2 cluster archaeon]
MDRMKVIAGALIMITLAGLPCRVCRRRGATMEWLH